jgi:hypothetical protein
VTFLKFFLLLLFHCCTHYLSLSPSLSPIISLFPPCLPEKQQNWCTCSKAWNRIIPTQIGISSLVICMTLDKAFKTVSPEQRYLKYFMSLILCYPYWKLKVYCKKFNNFNLFLKDFNIWSKMSKDKTITWIYAEIFRKFKICSCKCWLDQFTSFYLLCYTYFNFWKRDAYNMTVPLES